MTRICFAFLSLALLFVTGCAQVSPVTLQPVGPRYASATSETSNGLLKVYTARERAPIDVNAEEFFWNDDFGKNEFLYEPAHTAYAIYSSNNRLLHRVRNNTSIDDPRPAYVSLPPGIYHIVAQADEYPGAAIEVDVPVRIEPGLTTSVHLDGKWHPGTVDGSKLVRLPGGSLVGWQAQTETKIP